MVEVKSHLSHLKLLTSDAVVAVSETGTIEGSDTRGVKEGVITEAVDAVEDDGVEDTWTSCPSCLVAGSPKAASLQLSRSTMAWSARRRSRRRGRDRGGRKGVGGTWVTNGAVQLDIGHASSGGEVQGGLPTLAQDRDKLC